MQQPLKVCVLSGGVSICHRYIGERETTASTKTWAGCTCRVRWLCIQHRTNTVRNSFRLKSSNLFSRPNISLMPSVWWLCAATSQYYRLPHRVIPSHLYQDRNLIQILPQNKSLGGASTKQRCSWVRELPLVFLSLVANLQNEGLWGLMRDSLGSVDSTTSADN